MRATGLKKKPWLTIIGVNGDANYTLTQKAIQSIKYAELIMGAKRHIKNIKTITTISNKTFFSRKFDSKIRIRNKNAFYKSLISQ